MLNHSGVCLFLFFVVSTLFSAPQCSHTLHCSALLLVQTHMCTKPSLCRRTQTELTSSFCLPAVLWLSLGLRLFPSFLPCLLILPKLNLLSRSLGFSFFSWLLPLTLFSTCWNYHFNIIFYVQKVLNSVFIFKKTICLFILFQGSHNSCLLILPLCSLSTFLDWRGAALTFSPFLCLTTFIPFLASALKHTYCSKRLSFLKSSHNREMQQTDEIILFFSPLPPLIFPELGKKLFI